MLKWLKRLLGCLLLFIIIVGGIFIYQGYTKYREVIEQTPLEEKVESVYKDEDFVALADLPDVYKEAVILVEDRRFYQHFGVDFIGIGRAFINNIRAGTIVEGGSSITQQLAKNLYLENEQKLDRKIAEVFLALNIEHHYSKQEILEMYVNTIYFGHGYYGIGEASEGYFQKTASQLTDAESTILVGIPNAPSAYDWKKHKEKALERQKQVLDKMVKYGNLTEEEAKEMEYRE